MTTELIPTIPDVQKSVVTLAGRPPFMTSHDLARFYGVTPTRLMEQVRRNLDRFPEDFWFELRDDEYRHLVTQIAGPNRVNRGVFAGFTQEGALAASGVLKTPTANEVSVIIIRAFVAMRQEIVTQATHTARKLVDDRIAKRPIYVRIKLAADQGQSFEELWRATNYSKVKLSQAVIEMRMMGLIDAPLGGMTDDLFADA